MWLLWDDFAKSPTIVMIVVCSTETSTTTRWSPNAIPLPRFAKCGWRGCNGYANRDRSPWWFQICSLACWICSLPIWPRSEGRCVQRSTRCCSLRATASLIRIVLSLKVRPEHEPSFNLKGLPVCYYCIHDNPLLARFPFCQRVPCFTYKI